MALSPTGLRHISPTVWMKYVPINHHGETNAPVKAARAGGTRIANAMPPNTNAQREFRRAGRLPLAQSRSTAMRISAPGSSRRPTARTGTSWPGNRIQAARGGAPLRKQIQGRSGLFVSGPKYRRCDEQHQDRGRPFALRQPTTRGRQQPGENCQGNDNQDQAKPCGYSLRAVSSMRPVPASNPIAPRTNAASAASSQHCA